MGRAPTRRVSLGRSARFAYRARLYSDRFTGVVIEGRKAPRRAFSGRLLLRLRALSGCAV